MLFPGGVVYPEDLVRLARICDVICAEQQTPANSPASQRLAGHVLQLFLHGLTEDQELLGTMRRRLKFRPL